MATSGMRDLVADAPRRQAGIGLALAAGVIVAWLAVHIGAVFLWRWSPAGAPLALLLVALSCWFSVGLFIVAHDCIHGSLAPGLPAVNRRIGRVCLVLYGGFDYDAVAAKHFAHHGRPGTSDDPDFHDGEPQAFWRWFARFFREYFGGRQAAIVLTVAAVYLLVLGARVENVLVFWALPALLSALQLFTFGTYLPHRRGEAAFADRHNARTNAYPVWLSFLTCYHFGYHHEHHLAPAVPWWRLPAARRARDASTARPAGEAA
jgi:beta-carotene ketolase (CrtW type)